MALPIAAGIYKIDGVHSQLGFSVHHLGISIVRGTFDRFTGSLTVGTELEDTSVQVEAELASINSGNPARDTVLLGENFFDANGDERLSFRSTSVSKATRGEARPGYQLAGDLTIGAVTQPIVLAVTYNGQAPFPIDGSTHYGFSATGEISRSAFGISYGVPMVTDEVGLHLEAQFIQPASPD